MGKKILLIMVLAAFIAGGVFAQDYGKNTITVDIGPTLVGLGFGQLEKLIGSDDNGLSTSGFGIAAQYERLLFRNLGLAGRFAYLGAKAGISMGEGDVTAHVGVGIKSFSGEFHARLYPFGRAFYLGGMVGYGNMITDFSGDLVVSLGGYSVRPIDISATMIRHYVKYGGKLGWRITFGNERGFVFEPSFGYYGKFGLGDSIGQQLSREVGGGEIVGGFGAAFWLLESIIFVGGPRATLAFGWRF